MKQIRALVIKYLFLTAIVEATMALFGPMTFVGGLLWGLVLTIALYLIGDQLILRFLGNVPAAVADGGMAFVILLFAPGGWFLPLIAGIVILLAELAFHRYLLSKEIVPHHSLGSSGHLAEG
ncbi:MAG: DUF2512 family protein [Firmicutes bacterium]|nr:DUF2512 family protein [Bacillota bacterium]